MTEKPWPIRLVTRTVDSAVRVVKVAIAWLLQRKPVRAYLLYAEHNGPTLANSVTYQALFSVSAAVFIGFAITGVWLSGNPTAMAAIVSALEHTIPGLVGDEGLIHPSDLIHPISLTIAGAVALVGLVFASIGVVGTLRVAYLALSDSVADPVNVIWSYVRNLLLAVAFGVAIGLSAVLTFAGTWLLEQLASGLGNAQVGSIVYSTVQAVPVVVTFILDALIVVLLFLALSPVRADMRSLWSGAFIGAFGLTVLQFLSRLFVSGAGNNPLLASFGSVVALLLWFNLSAQVLLISAAYTITGMDEVRWGRDLVRARTFEQRRVQRAEIRLATAQTELDAARQMAHKASPGD